MIQGVVMARGMAVKRPASAQDVEAILAACVDEVVADALDVLLASFEPLSRPKACDRARA